MKKLILGLLISGLASQAYAQVVQTEQLSEVVVMAANYKYLNESDNKEAAIPVKMLERKVAAYDVQESGFYQDDWGLYTVSFYIPDGKIVAVYDSEGKVVRTIEHFKDVALPKEVRNALATRFPNWELTGDTYRINYNDRDGAKKNYKIRIKNGEKTMKVKMSESGEFL